MFEESLEIQRRELVARAIAQGMTYDEIHEKYGVPITVVREMAKLPEFQEMVGEYVYNLKNAAQYRLAAAARDAVDDLVSFLGHPNISPREELAAIEMILSYVLRPEDSKARELATKKLKGLSKKTVDDIKKQILGVEV